MMAPPPWLYPAPNDPPTGPNRALKMGFPTLWDAAWPEESAGPPPPQVAYSESSDEDDDYDDYDARAFSLELGEVMRCVLAAHLQCTAGASPAGPCGPYCGSAWMACLPCARA